MICGLPESHSTAQADKTTLRTLSGIPDIWTDRFLDKASPYTPYNFPTLSPKNR